MLKSGEARQFDSWMDVVSRVCEVENERLEKLLKVDMEPYTRIVDACVGLHEYLVKKGLENDKFISRRHRADFWDSESGVAMGLF
ncbi:pentatricopeptide repeat protein [Artemisia annua]|uniref:Pentatricopeptide repeat protein n=1 Tax=Artemisia annua TaxID=35608 RepID=A0A2U1LLG1_ARTAN|nr:pentatricopeptide repeat protein [Artemisia annua]